MFSSQGGKLSGAGADQLGLEISAPSKLFLADASVILFSEGFAVRNDTVRGVGERHFLAESHDQPGSVSVPLDSVLAMTYYELDYPPLMQVGSAMLIVYGSAVSALAIHCLQCPKCCFGSCPTVYSDAGTGFELEAELFSYSISRFTQQTDLDRPQCRPGSRRRGWIEIEQRSPRNPLHRPFRPDTRRSSARNDGLSQPRR